MKLMKLLNALILVIITGIIIAGCGGGGSTGYTGGVSYADPTAIPTAIPAATAAPSGGGVFKVTVNIPGYEVSKKDTLTADVLPYGSKTLRVTITGEAIDPPLVEETPIPSPDLPTVTITVPNVPVGLNEALIEVLDEGGNVIAHYKHGFYMTAGGTVTPPGVIYLGVVITGGNYRPQNIDVAPGTELYFENWDSVERTVETTPALNPAMSPIAGVTPAAQPNTAAIYHSASYTFNTAGTFTYAGGDGGRVLVYDTPSISGFTPGSGDEGDAVTITGSNFNTNASDNIVAFNGVHTTTISATETTLTVKVPVGATTGKISVTTPGGTVTSDKYFYPMELRTDDSCTLAQFYPPDIIFTHDFYVGRYEITNAQYRLWPDAESHHGHIIDLNYSDFDNYPVRYVNWMDVCQYCNWLSSEEGLTACYTIGNVGDHNTYTVDLAANGYRLPTEAEWEYACRGGTATNYYWGDTLNATVGVNKCWYGYYDSPQGTCTTGLPAPVGYGGSHPWGLYDMSGNLWEWCHNVWESPPSGGSDPVGPGTGSFRVVRGGSWNNFANYCRSAYRGSFVPSNRGDYIGFRPVRTAP